MRVLVTGASGFIGRALLGGLSRDPTLTIVGASRGSDGLGDRAERVLIGDISGHTDWSSALSGVTSVVHTAARVHVTDDKGADTLALYRRVNVQGTLALARQAARAGVKRLVFLSSIKVNGESTSPGRPFTTNDDPAPQDSYGVSKLEAERGLRALAEKTGLEVVIIRPVLVYGPGVGANFLALMKLIRTGMLLPLGAIDNQRSFLALENLVDFVFASLRHPAAANKTFLVSDGEDVSTPALVRGIAAAMNRRVRLLPVPEPMLRTGGKILGRSAVVDRLCGWLQADISRTRTALQWAPPIRLSEGIHRTVRHFLENQE